jgi:serine/threonine-protein kinase HipA
VVCTDIYPELDGLMALKLNKSKTFLTNKEIVAYGNRLGLSEAEVTKTLARIESAYNTVVSRCEKDARYQNVGLLTEIQNAIKRTDLRNRPPVIFR